MVNTVVAHMDGADPLLWAPLLAGVSLALAWLIGGNRR